MNYQNVKLLGNIATDPKLIKAKNPEKKDFVSFNVAVNNSEKEANYYTVLAFNNLAEIVKGFKKGHLVRIEGALGFNTYASNEGETKFQVKVIASEVLQILMESKSSKKAPKKSK